MTDPLVEEFQQAQGAYHLAQLIGALKEIQDKDPTFALSACADAVLAVEALIKGRPMPNLLMLKGSAQRWLLFTTASPTTRRPLFMRTTDRQPAQVLLLRPLYAIRVDPANDTRINVCHLEER